MKYALIYCPKHSISSTKSKLKTIEVGFKSRNLDYILFNVSKEHNVAESVALAIAEGCRTLVVIGGDRSLNHTVNALMQQPERVWKQIKVGIIPNGTINAFAGFWGLRDRSVNDCIDYIERGKSRKIDAGLIHYEDKNGQHCHRYFMNCVNIGLSAYITQVRHNTRKILFSRRLSFVVSTLVLIFQRSIYHMRFNLNHEIVDSNFMTVCIGNCTGYGQTPSAVPYNGMLDVSAVGITPLSGIFMGFYLLLTGKFLRHKTLKPFRTCHIDFQQTSSSVMSVDGAMVAIPQHRFTIEIAKEVIEFIIPYRK